MQKRTTIAFSVSLNSDGSEEIRLADERVLENDRMS